MNTTTGEAVRCEYLLDLDDRSFGGTHTPSPLSRQLPFFLLGYGHFIAKSGYYTDRTGLDNYLLIYTLEGEGYLKYREGEAVLRSKQAFLIHCMEPHFYRTGAGGYWEFKYIHFSGSACPCFHQLINEERLEVVTIPGQYALESCLDSVFRPRQINSISNEAQISLLLNTIMTYMVKSRYEAPCSPSDRYSQAVETVIRHIREHYSEKLSIKDLTRLVHISEYHFIRLFKRLTGVSPYEYLMHYRINQSKLLLTQTTLTVEEISYRTGFGNINNFIREFKKLTGTTPLKYRRLFSS